MSFVYLRRVSDGQVLDMTEEQAQETMRRGGFEMLGQVVVAKAEELPVVKKEESNECILCGFEGKNAQSLRMHRQKTHA